MASRSELDEWFGKSEVYSQNRFFEVPKPALDFFNQLKEQRKLTVVGEPKPAGEKFTRVVTRVSDIETIYPKLLKAQVKETSHEETGGDEMIEAGIILHRLTNIINLIFQGNVGARVKRALPSADEKEIRKVQEVTDGLWIDRALRKDQARQVLLVAWHRLLELRQEVPSQNLPLIPGQGLRDPRVIIEFVKSERLYEMGVRLIDAWLDRVFELDDELLAWNFGEDYESLNEVTIILNTEWLQIKTRLDQVTRPRAARKKVVAEVIDFKTGKGTARNWLEEEVKKRQAQLMCFIAERFVSTYMLNEKWLNYGKTAFIISGYSSNNKFEGRCRFAYLRFNRESGELCREDINLSGDDRLEFLGWLDWYSERLSVQKHSLRGAGNGYNQIGWGPFGSKSEEEPDFI